MTRIPAAWNTASNACVNVNGDLANDPAALLDPQTVFLAGHRIGDTLR